MIEQEQGKPSGLFLTLEGPDGAGKTTQARLLQERLQGLGKETLLVREPGGTPIGEVIRGLLLDPLYKEMSVVCEVLLYCAARAQLVTEQIRPALARKAVVISDRYWDSTLAYQGLAGGEETAMISIINIWATGGLVPRRTFLLDLDVEKGLLRVRGDQGDLRLPGGDRMEQKELDFHQKVRRAFLELASREKDRICVIPADRAARLVHESIWEKVLPLLQLPLDS